MNYTEKARKLALDFYQSNDALKQQEATYREQLNAKRITREVHAEHMSEIRGKRDALLKSASAGLDTLKGEYTAAVNTWAALDGSKVHDDIKLLDGHFTLTDAELTALSEKHKTNITMQRAISSYAHKNNLTYLSATPTPEKKIKAFESLCDTIQSSFRDSDSDFLTIAYIKDDEQFPALTGTNLLDHGENDIFKQEPISESEKLRKMIERGKAARRDALGVQ